MRDILRFVRHVLAMNAFANKSTSAFLKAYCGEDIHIVDNRYQPRIGETGKHVAFVSTEAVMARVLVEKASKLSKPDNSSVRLDRIAYTNIVEARISFEITDHFDIVIAITNITTPVHKNSNELFRPPGHENIRAELANAQPNNLPTLIKGHSEWDSNIISYKIGKSPAVIIFIEVKHQKRLSSRYFIENLCSLLVSTGVSLQLIKMDES
ncbi:8116_t:CDS:2 [Funneliformis geosporum]|nr:8116_t:CDS:2 [Funneliformis geosporum]